MVYLSRSDIEKIAEPIIQIYKSLCVPEKHLCYSVDLLELISILGYSVVYVNITKDGSILGQTSSCQIWTTILDDSMNETLFLLDGKTILIDKRLLLPSLVGRRNFTIAHELGHYALEHHLHSGSLFCSNDGIMEEGSAALAIEREANHFATCLLMPEEKIRKAFKSMLYNSHRLRNKDFLYVNKATFGAWCGIRDDLMKRYGVSEEALRNRLRSLNLAKFNF